MTDLKSSDHSFSSPPVFETALTIQFDELALFRSTHFGLFYETVKERFPVVEDHPRVETIEETFPIRFRHLSLNFERRKGGPERIWFRDRADGTVLLQLQPNRFGLNWSRTNDQEPYPRFEQNGARFLQEFSGFEGFCAEQGIGKVRPNLCEVVYVNHVFPNPDESPASCMESILAGVSFNPDARMPMPELVTYNCVFPIDGCKGRLYVETGIGRQRDKGDFVLLKITSRIVPNDGDEMHAVLQRAHDALIDRFVASTSDDARERRWGQTK